MGIHSNFKISSFIVVLVFFLNIKSQPEEKSKVKYGFLS